MIEKKEIRDAIKGMTLALSQEETLLQSKFVAERLLQLVEQRQPKVVALFVPLRDEIQIANVVSQLQCRVVLPRVEGDDMEFYDYSKEQLAEGAYGILEPQGGVPCGESEIELMVVPGVAFTSSGDRLGRGKGYYDRYLSRSSFRAYCVGVCYAHQLLQSLPVEPHDRTMDVVLCKNE